MAAPSDLPLNRIIVIGASAGGVGALCTLIADLPHGLPAAVFVVQHIGRTSILTEVLRRCHAQADIIVDASNGAEIRPGLIHIAVPDHHLILDGDRMRLRKTPRENMHRPSIDVLFRSAARAHGPKVVGVILTGALDDGTSGLFSVKSRGGVAVVQDPNDALVPEMPSHALETVEVDYCLPLSGIAPVLVELAKTAPPAAAENSENGGEPPGTPASFVCPDCDGPLTQTEQGALMTFRCKIGHRYSLEGLSNAHSDTLERGLWIAVRTLEDRAAIQRTRARHFREQNEPERAEPLLEIALQAERDAKRLREILEHL
ncbi:MAG TPA: chemotaxis protein CheB [Terriglobales bacterium]|nr:chemotaxis protein CheB [Terriglobales bacterium]